MPEWKRPRGSEHCCPVPQMVAVAVPVTVSVSLLARGKVGMRKERARL